jgi:nucleoside-diphosphate-sugar epimerase
LAAITDAERSFERSTEVHNINYKGTKFIAEACANNNVPLIMISTTSVYGKQSGIVDENCTDLKPQSPYAESKLLAEDYLREIGVTIDLKFIILRFGTIYGTSLGMRFHTAVNKFCWQATLREPVSVWETAYEQLRPYLDIADATKLIFFLIEKRLFHQKTYNAVTRNASVRDIVDIISEEIGEVEIKFVKSSIMNQLSYEVTAEKITAKGFEFSGDLSRGIKDTLLQLESIRNQIPFNIQVK